MHKWKKRSTEWVCSGRPTPKLDMSVLLEARASLTVVIACTHRASLRHDPPKTRTPGAQTKDAHKSARICRCLRTRVRTGLRPCTRAPTLFSLGGRALLELRARCASRCVLVAHSLGPSPRGGRWDKYAAMNKHRCDTHLRQRSATR